MSSSSHISQRSVIPPDISGTAGAAGIEHAPAAPANRSWLERLRGRLAWKRWLAASVIWIGIALLFTTQDYLVLADTERATPWSELAKHKLVVWLLWGALSPLIIAVARRYPISGRHAVRNLLFHLPGGIIFPLLNIFLFLLLATPLGMNDEPDVPFFTHLFLGFRNTFAITFAIYAVTVIVVHALEFYRAYRRRELIASQLETRLAEARLDVLRMQLQPHFLFNTLHGISALMEKDVSAARRMIARLSSLLRLSLEQDGAQEISLANELEFLEQYIEIQRMRFHDRLTVTVEADPDTRDLLVPRLILQPLVENSIRHGIARHARPGHIGVYIGRDGDLLRIVVRDNGPGLGGRPIREGVGIGNTRARLEHLYGAGQSFTMEDIPEGGLMITITIPVRPATGEHAAV